MERILIDGKQYLVTQAGLIDYDSAILKHNKDHKLIAVQVDYCYSFFKFFMLPSESFYKNNSFGVRKEIETMLDYSANLKSRSPTGPYIHTGSVIYAAYLAGINMKREAYLSHNVFFAVTPTEEYLQLRLSSKPRYDLLDMDKIFLSYRSSLR